MKLATLITVYKQPYLIKRLLTAMHHENFHFYLHIDKKADIKQYLNLQELPNVFIIKKRLDIKWAAYSMVEALLAGMEEILSSGVQYDFINHMSGQCYPIKTPGHIYQYLEQHRENNFLSCEAQPNAWWEDARYRFERYHFPDSAFKGSHRMAQIATYIMPKRKLPFDFTMYGSDLGAYWILNKEAAKYVVGYMKNHPQVEDFFRKTWGPDEFLFNTIIMNSAFKGTVINNNFRYIDWSGGESHPKILTSEDYPELTISNCFFARKFDLTVDSAILDKIDSELL